MVECELLCRKDEARRPRKGSVAKHSLGLPDTPADYSLFSLRIQDSLEDLTGWVVDLFSPVPNKGLPAVTSFDSDPFGPTVHATTTFIKTVKDIQSLELAWVIPDQETLYKTKPASFLSHYLGHEGPGSILSYLKKKGWVNSLSAGPSEGATGWGFLRVSCDLTPEGLENYEQIATAVFSYLGLLAKSGPQPDAFQEVQSLADLNFQFAEKSSSPSDYASDLASQLSGPWPKEWTLSQPWLMRGFDGEQVKKTLECLTVEKCKLTLASQTLPKAVAARGTWDKTEAIYKTEYRVEKFSDEFVKAAHAAVSVDEFALPVPNEFIPKDVHVDKVEGVEVSPSSFCLRASPRSLRLMRVFLLSSSARHLPGSRARNRGLSALVQKGRPVLGPPSQLLGRHEEVSLNFLCSSFRPSIRLLTRHLFVFPQPFSRLFSPQRRQRPSLHRSLPRPHDREGLRRRARRSPMPDHVLWRVDHPQRDGLQRQAGCSA